MKKANRLYCLGTAGVVALAISSTGHAQGGAPSAPAGSQAAPQNGVDDAAARDIIVTGSRIARDGSEQPTPVAVVNTAELIKTAPASIAEGLNQLPVFQNSINANQQQFTQGNRQRTGNYLNLRALGTQRVLVLLDGQRLPPSGTNGGVDATLVPQLLTERVDVVTGGASAVYGSDAVSGVVNFVLNKRFEGLTGQAQRGISSRGDNGSYRLGLAGGFSAMDDRLHVIASAERYHSDGLVKTDRPIIADSYQAVGLGTAGDPIRVVDDVRFGTISEAGLIRSGPLAGRQFGQNGNTIAFDPGVPSGSPGTQRGGDGALIGQGCCTITPSQTSNQVFARASFNVTDDIEVFVLGGYNWSQASDAPVPVIRSNVTVYSDNAFLSPETRAALGSTRQFSVGKIFNNRPGNEINQKSSSLNIQAGVKGKLGGLTWTLGYVHGETRFRTTNDDLNNAKYYAAADAVRDSGGNIVCRVNLTNPGLYPGCVPINIFGIGNESDAAYAYVLDKSSYRAVNKLDSFEASISGELFDGWAGPISFALGAEYRKQSLDQTTNSDPTLAPDFTGLRGVAAGDLKFAMLNVGPARGSYNVKEAFVELEAPLLRDSAIGSLSLNGAARVTDYSTSGTVVTWKGGGIFDPVDGVRLRATYSRDIRAPTLYELFAGQSSSTVVFTDRLTNSQATSRQVSGGNPSLKPEIAKTFTGGVVLKPRFLPGFTFSADYFNIKISDAIATPFSAFQLVDLCAASGYTSPLCDQIIRPLGANNPDPANTPTEIQTYLQNVSKTSLSGIDFEASYTHPVGEGRLIARAAATRLISFDQQTAPGQPTTKFVGTADYNDVQFPLPLPKWRGTFNLGYDSENFAINVQERVIGGYKRSAGPLIYVDNSIKAIAYTDLNVTFKVRSGPTDFDLFATVNNLFDKDAPIVPVTRTSGLTVPTIRSTYDIVGRYLTVGVRVKM